MEYRINSISGVSGGDQKAWGTGLAGIFQGCQLFHTGSACFAGHSERLCTSKKIIADISVFQVNAVNPDLRDLRQTA
jgi:hypothetical protein